jgi:hypothetical protein
MSSINKLPQPSLASTSPPLPTLISDSPSLIQALITLLSLPSKGTFASFDQLFNTYQQYTRLVGYAFTTAKSEKRDRRVIKILRCKRGGRHRATINEDCRIQDKSLFKSNCQASIKARERLDRS